MKTLITTLLFFAAGLSTMAQSQPDLKINPERNRVYRFKTVTEQTTTQTVSGIQQNSSTKSDYTLSLKMMDATPDYIVVDVRFDTILTAINSMGVSYTINSATEGDIHSENMGEVLSCIMHRLSGNSLYMKINHAGKILTLFSRKGEPYFNSSGAFLQFDLTEKIRDAFQLERSVKQL